MSLVESGSTQIEDQTTTNKTEEYGENTSNNQTQDRFTSLEELDINKKSILETSFTIINSSHISNKKEREGEVIDDSKTNNQNNCWNDISRQKLEVMGMDELLVLCKEYRNRVVSNATENDIMTLQMINSILEEKVRISQIPVSNTSHSIREEFEGKMHNLKEETISGDSIDVHKSSSDEECGPSFHLVKKSISGIPCQLYAEEEEEEEEGVQLSPILQSSKSNKYVFEEVEGKVFHCDIIKPLELRTIRVRRRQSLECDPKRQKKE